MVTIEILPVFYMLQRVFCMLQQVFYKKIKFQEKNENFLQYFTDFY